MQKFSLSALPILLTSEQLSDLLDEHPVTTRRRRQTGTGPRFIKIGSKVRYRLEDVQAWLDGLPVGGAPKRGRPRKQTGVVTQGA